MSLANTLNLNFINMIIIQYYLLSVESALSLWKKLLATNWLMSNLTYKYKLENRKFTNIYYIGIYFLQVILNIMVKSKVIW